MPTLPSCDSHFVRNVNLLSVDQICFLCCCADTGFKVLLVVLDLLLEVLSAYEPATWRLHILVNVQVSQLILTSSRRTCPEWTKVTLLGTFHRWSHHTLTLWRHHACHGTVWRCAFTRIEVSAVHLKGVIQVHHWLCCIVKRALLGLELGHVVSCLLSSFRIICLSFLRLRSSLGQKIGRTYRDGGVRYLSVELYGLITLYKVACWAVIRHVCPALCRIVVHLE